MNLNEALKKLTDAGYEVLKEGRYNEYSDIGMNPGWDDDQSGRYEAKVEWINNDKLKDASQRIFGNDEFLFDIMTSFDVPDKVTFEYNERKDEDTDFEWSDPDTASWFENQEVEVMEAIRDSAAADGIEFSEDYVNEHIHDICVLLQQSVDYCIDSYDYNTREPA